MYNKYTRPTTAGHYTIDDDASIYIPMLNGRKTSQRRRFEKYQEREKFYEETQLDQGVVLGALPLHASAFGGSAR
jgi:hypothetical protein